MKDKKKLGVLYLIPCGLGDTPSLEVLPLSVRRIIDSCQHFVVEHEKTARAFIKKTSPNKNQKDLVLYPLNKFSTFEEVKNYLNPAMEGYTIGLISDAGCPAVADPGALIVQMAHAKGIEVKPLVGPSSILLALMASGLNGQSFTFQGYLPIEKADRKKAIKKLEQDSKQLQQAQLFIETPYRNNSLYKELLQLLRPETMLCIACDLTLTTEFIETKRVQDWKNTAVDFHKRPAIFIVDCSELSSYTFFV
ncbi:MAG: SAM-dependent methyltransferase [Flavobacteriaceae bacterium]